MIRYGQEQTAWIATVKEAGGQGTQFGTDQAVWIYRTVTYKKKKPDELSLCIVPE